MAVSTEETRGWRSATVTKLSLWFNPWWPLRHRVDVKEKTTSIEIATCVAAFKDASKRATSPDQCGAQCGMRTTQPSRSSSDWSETVRIKNPVATISIRRVEHTVASASFERFMNTTVCTFDTLSSARYYRGLETDRDETRWNGILFCIREVGI